MCTAHSLDCLFVDLCIGDQFGGLPGGQIFVSWRWLTQPTGALQPGKRLKRLAFKRLAAKAR